MNHGTMSRRSFLAKASLLFGGAASVGGGCALLGRKPGMKKVMFNLRETRFAINPAFRSVELDRGRLELFTFLRSGERLSHTFSGMEADLLSAIHSQSPIRGLVSMLAPQYKVSETECVRRFTASIDELTSAGVVLFADTDSISVVETTYERSFPDNV